MMNDEQKRSVQRRLARIAGQVDGIKRMVDDDRYCMDVCVQVAAARSALTRVAETVLAAHVDTCIAEAFEHGTRQDRQDKLHELFDIFGRFAKL